MNVVVGPGAAAHYPAPQSRGRGGLAPPVGAYVTFYEAEVDEPVTAATWRHLLSPESNMFGRLAEPDRGFE